MTIAFSISSYLPFSYAVLSQNIICQEQNLISPHSSPLYQAYYRLKMVKGGGIKKNVFRKRLYLFLPNGQGNALRPAPVGKPLLYLAFGSPVVFYAPFCGVSLAVGLPAPKGTVKILSTSIARMGEKKYPAMPAPGQTFS